MTPNIVLKISAVDEQAARLLSSSPNRDRYLAASVQLADLFNIRQAAQELTRIRLCSDERVRDVRWEVRAAGSVADTSASHSMTVGGLY